jgi:hypothetical protein
MPPAVKVTAKAVPLSAPLKLGPTGNAFYDDFATSASSTNWAFYQGSKSFTGGRLRLTVNQNAGMYAWTTGKNWTNLSVSADIKLDTATTWGAAVGVRLNTNNGVGYQTWIYGSGRLTIEKYPSDWYNNWQEVATTTITAPGTTTNNVKLSITNNVLTVYLNGVQRLTYTDTSSPILSGGAADLGVWGGNGTCRAYFDNVTVFSFDAVTPPTTNPPVMVTGLTNKVALQGTNITLAVTTTGNPLTYQWRFNNNVIAGATNSSYTLTNVQPSKAGTYSVFVTNVLGMASSKAYLSVGTTNILTSCISTAKTSVTLAWCPSPPTTNSPIAGYKVYYGSGAVTNWVPDVYDTNQPPCPGVIVQHGTNWFRAYTNSVQAGTNLTATVSNLVSGATYYFSATASDTNALESDFSSEVSTTLPLPVIKPVTNAVVSIANIGNGKVQLQTKLCPSALATVLVKTNLMQSGWNVLATNVMSDAYGNFFYADSSVAPMKFYRLQLQ